MRLITGKKEVLEDEAVKIIMERMNKLNKIKSKKHILMGIPGGRSVKEIFEKLSKSKIDWKKVHIFWVDERFVDLASNESNYMIAKNALIDNLIKSKKIPKENIHAFDYKKGIKAYEKEFKKIGNYFDIIILGVGEDGHVASLFPENSINDDSEGFIHIKNSPKLPKERISASRKLLEKSDTAILLFFGENKKQAFENFKNKKTKVEKCPAKLVENIKNYYVLNDIQ